MIKLEALRVFVTVAEIGNISDAADRLGRTPSAVSMALKQLEDEIGARLFATDRKNALTALGAFALETARAQIRGYDKAVDTIRAFAQNRIGRLTLACVPSVAASLMPGLLRGLIADRPAVEVELFDVDTAGVAALVESGQADLGIAGMPRTVGVLAFRPLFRDRFKLVCPADNALAALGRPVGWTDLEGQTLIRNGASESIQAPGYRALADQATLMVRNVTSLVAMAASGVGVTLLPALSTVRLPAGACACALADDTVFREVGLLERRAASRSPVAQAFIDLLAGRGGDLFRELHLEPVSAIRRLSEGAGHS